MGSAGVVGRNPLPVAQQLVRELKDNGVHAVFHYVPLHSSPGGMRFGRAHGDLSLTTSLSERLIRLPMWLGLGEAQQQRVCEVLGAILKRLLASRTPPE